jgi:hypothetical protein
MRKKRYTPIRRTTRVIIAIATPAVAPVLKPEDAS